MKISILRGKRVLVTGAAAGIGYATALAFARRGANLVIADIDERRLDEARKAIDELGVHCFARIADVSNQASMQAFADAVHDQVGAVDVLVNNAGIGYLGPFIGSPLESWNRTFGVNVMGVVHGCHYFLPRMIAAGGCRRIVNVASLAAIAPAPNMSAYAATKSAVLGFSDVLTMELKIAGTSVGVTTVCPGVINTDITSSRANVADAISDSQLTTLQAYYRKNGASADLVADAIVNAVMVGEAIVLVGPFARLMYNAKRLSRRLVEKLMLAEAKKLGYS
ncbi:SDR family NAD(P)-dependent oxidoreductase [Paraburkholderia sp. CI3]|uniref:SDR family NAD(P)-dependent oxidoreductase n=1 Tax=Paraburkholderia sp. CI3 TaxID=2991060 RepID=UPI003D19BD9E